MRSMELFAYETYAQPKRRGFAKIKDTERTITIALAAGKGVIIEAYAYDVTTMARITKAYPGQHIGVYVQLRNDGDKDTLWMTVMDKDTGAYIKNQSGVLFNFEMVVDAGRLWGNNLGIVGDPIIMPNKDFVLLVQGGHVT